MHPASRRDAATRSCAIRTSSARLAASVRTRPTTTIISSLYLRCSARLAIDADHSECRARLAEADPSLYPPSRSSFCETEQKPRERTRLLRPVGQRRLMMQFYL